MSTFDPNAFLDQTISDANSTSVTPCPPGEHSAYVDKIAIRPWTSKTDSTKSGVALDVSWKVTSQEAIAHCEREEIFVKQGVMLDLTDDGSQLDMSRGKNVGLGRLREALGLNVPGQPFNMNMIPGRSAVINVVHEPNPNDPESVYTNVRGVRAPV